MVGLVLLRHHEKPGGVLIEPMHDSGTDRAPDSGQAPDLKQKGVHQRPRPMSWSRVHHHPGGFIHHKEVLILIDDVNGDRLWHGVRLTGGWELHLDSVALAKGL